MPFFPFFCPYMNQQFDENEDEDFRSPNGFAPPFSPGQGPGFGPPSGGQGGPPSGPPPSFTPSLTQAQGPGVFAVDPGAIRPCTFQFVFIRLTNRRSFWAWLTFVGRNSVAGYRWNGRRWVYFGVDLRRIDSFFCL
jgi:hypothetical protein